MAFSSEHTRDGYLSPWEVAKAAALDSVISDVERHLGKSCWQLIGRGKVPYMSFRSKGWKPRDFPRTEDGRLISNSSGFCMTG